MNEVRLRVVVADGVDPIQAAEQVRGAVMAQPGVTAVELEREASRVSLATVDRPRLEETSHFNVFPADGGDPVTLQRQQFLVLRALWRVGMVTSQKALQEAVLVYEGELVGLASLSRAYSSLLPIMDAIGYPMTRRRGRYGFRACEAATRQGRGSVKRRRKLEEEI